MTISTAAKQRRSSERFMLVRLTPAHYAVDDLASQGSGVYGYTFTSGPVARVERNGVTLTETTGTPGSNDLWSHDETTNAFKVKLAGAPSTSNVIVIYYYLFYTGHRTRKAYETPSDSASALRDWQPRISEYPTVLQSFTNIVSGLFSTDNNSLEIVNTDGAFEAYLGTNESFNNKSVEIWLCVDSTSDMEQVYTGKIASLGLSKGIVRIRFYDSFSRLNQSAYMGDTDGEAYFSRRTGSFPSLDPNKQYKPCPLILAGRSPYSLVTVPNYINDALRIGKEGTLEAACTSYTSTLSTSNNRTWGLCRVQSGGLRLPVFPAFTPTNVNRSSRLTEIVYLNAQFATADLEIGDNVKMVDGAVTLYGRVISFTVYASLYTSVTIYNNEIGAYALTTAMTITPYPVALVLNEGGVDYYPRYGLDYTYSTSTTTAGNKYVSITFVNNFEASASMTGMSTPLDPSTHSVFFRVMTTTTALNHADVLSSICSNAGLTVDSATFATAKAALAVNTAFMIPTIDESEYGTYRDYAQRLLESTLGYVRMGLDQEVEYKLLAAPSSSTSISDDLILRESMDVSIDYEDIVSEIVTSNPHYRNKTSIDAVSTPDTISSSTKAQYLHGLVRSERLEHVLESITDRIASILSVKAARRVIYTFETSTENLSTLLGEDLQLDTDFVLGSTKSLDVKIISLDKGPKKVSLQATDLKDL